MAKDDKFVSILGIVGGIFGICGGLFVVLFGVALGSITGTSTVFLQGWIAIASSAAAIVASSQAATNPRRSGWIIIVSSLIGITSISFLYILPGILLLIAGIKALKNKQ